ncbi:hypothetical protein ACHAQH_010003 [Verticillium albo-atrum]
MGLMKTGGRGGGFGTLNGLPVIVAITIQNAVSMAWYVMIRVCVFSGVLISEDFKRWFPETNNSNISGVTSSCFALGAFFGAMKAFTFGDRLGRKKCVALSVYCNSLGAIL